MLLYFIPHVFYLQPAPELLTTSATMAKTAMINNVLVVKYRNMKEIETLKKKKILIQFFFKQKPSVTVIGNSHKQNATKNMIPFI